VIFTAIGIALAAYTALSAWRGEVYARKGPWGQTISREASPVYFWVVIGIYAALPIALMTVF
jgi:hypothetical protein